MIENETDESKKKLSSEDHRSLLTREYSTKYRVIKTLLFICCWISMSFNNEMMGPALEDLKILLNANYQQISFAVIAKNIGYLTMTVFSGFILEKFSNHTHTLMACAKLFVAIRKI